MADRPGSRRRQYQKRSVQDLVSKCCCNQAGVAIERLISAPEASRPCSDERQTGIYIVEFACVKELLLSNLVLLIV